MVLGGSALFQSNSSAEITEAPSEGSGGWPQYHYDAQNSNTAPNTIGPTAESLTTKWVFDTEDAANVRDHYGFTKRYVVTEEQNGLAAFDLQTGSEVWRFTGEPPTSPIVAGDEMVFYIRQGWDGAAVHAVDIETGDQQWTAPVQTTDPSDLPSLTPVIADGTVFVPAALDETRGVEKQDLVAYDAATGDVKWRSSALAGKVSTAGSYIYSVSLAQGETTAYLEVVIGDVNTGDLIIHHWKRIPEYDSDIAAVSYPVVVDGELYVGGDAGVGPREHRIYAFEASNAGPREELPEPSFDVGSELGSPFLVDERLYLVEPGTDGYAIRLEGEKPTLQLDYDGDGEFDIVVPAEGITHSHDNTSWSYEDPGTYTVTVQVRDTYGLTTSTSKMIEIFSPDEFPALGEAEITILNEDDQECTRTFQANITGDYSEESEYEWILYEGDTSDSGRAVDTGQQWTHRFSQSGTFTVRLRVRDSLGRTTSTSVSFEISA